MIPPNENATTTGERTGRRKRKKRDTQSCVLKIPISKLFISMDQGRDLESAIR